VALSKQLIIDRIETFDTDAKRALALYKTLVTDGYTCSNNAQEATRLRQVDRRDAAQFIFFELAAKFESLSRDLFEFEVRIHLADSPKRAEYIMGNVDRGLRGVMGWASPSKLAERAENLFGKVGFFAKLKEHLDHVDNTTYERLVLAHKIRNRIAHSGTKEYREALATLQIPSSARKGCSPGRALVEYPRTAAGNNRWFHRFIAAYRSFARIAQTKLRVPGP
jgi:hypothetical protein